MNICLVFVIGVLVGVAGTLALSALMMASDRDQRQERFDGR